MSDTPQPPAKSEEELRALLRQRIHNISTAAENDMLALIKQEAEAHADASLASIKPPTMNDVFPEKPYDGSNAHSDMAQVVKYYEEAIAEQRKRNVYPAERRS